MVALVEHVVDEIGTILGLDWGQRRELGFLIENVVPVWS
jgi:hypothetical protein